MTEGKRIFGEREIIEDILEVVERELERPDLGVEERALYLAIVEQCDRGLVRLGRAPSPARPAREKPLRFETKPSRADFDPNLNRGRA